MDYEILYYTTILILIVIIIAIFYYLYNYHCKETPIEENFETKQYSKIDNFKTKIQVLENQVNNILKEEYPNVDKEKELFDMYYKGIPDTYDTRGNLIHGVEPDALKAIMYLNIIINSPYGTEQDILRLARLYHYGMHKFERDLDKAEEIYNRLKFENISDETRIFIKEALVDIQKIRVYAWLNLPLERPTVNPDITNIAPQNINNINNVQIHIPHRQQRPPRPPRPTIYIPVIEDNHTQEIDNKEYNDPQNTHNPQVLSTIRVSLEKIKKNTPIIKDQGQTSKEIREYINTLDDSDKRYDALRSLREIETNKEKLSSTDMSEMDALTLVWNRLNDTNKFNQETSDNLKETMFDELASMQEFGVSICSTGRFTHIIDTLNGVDEEVVIKPTYAINEEMMTKSAKIREDLLKEIPEPERKTFEMGTNPNQDDFDSKLKRTIITKLKEDYVDTNILTETKFTNEINKWIDHI